MNTRTAAPIPNKIGKKAMFPASFPTSSEIVYRDCTPPMSVALTVIVCEPPPTVTTLLHEVVPLAAVNVPASTLTSTD